LLAAKFFLVVTPNTNKSKTGINKLQKKYKKRNFEGAETIN